MTYEFIRFEKAKAKGKKYSAILMNTETKRTKRVNFGDSSMEQYKDTTGLGLYSNLDHNDEDRRESFRARFRESAKVKYSPSWFSYNFLW
jgi:hypothetical protein